jgi:hypothetical protein
VERTTGFKPATLTSASNSSRNMEVSKSLLLPLGTKLPSAATPRCEPAASYSVVSRHTQLPIVSRSLSSRTAHACMHPPRMRTAIDLVSVVVYPQMREAHQPMADLMAVCPNGHVVGGLISFDSGTIVLENNQAQCSICGELAAIPDGTYRLEGDRITRQDIAELASELGSLTRPELLALRRLLADGLQLPDDFRARVPLTSKGLDPLGPRSQTIGTWVGVVIALITLYLTVQAAHHDPDVVNTTINQTFLQVEEGNLEVPEVGRNQLCLCGSGTKFKYCHGR